MLKINWYGNDGRMTPDAGTKKTATCGVCGARMKVERNVVGATSWAESMSGRKHTYDLFLCPHFKEEWHKEIYRLKNYVHRTEIDMTFPRIFFKKRKEEAKKEILKLLKAHAAR